MIQLNDEEISLLFAGLDAIFDQDAGEEDETNRTIMNLEVKLNNYYEETVNKGQ